jgi:hypothetical protein
MIFIFRKLYQSFIQKTKKIEHVARSKVIDNIIDTRDFCSSKHYSLLVLLEPWLNYAQQNFAYLLI